MASSGSDSSISASYAAYPSSIPSQQFAALFFPMLYPPILEACEVSRLHLTPSSCGPLAALNAVWRQAACARIMCELNGCACHAVFSHCPRPAIFRRTSYRTLNPYHQETAATARRLQTSSHHDLLSLRNRNFLNLGTIRPPRHVPPSARFSPRGVRVKSL